MQSFDTDVLGMHDQHPRWFPEQKTKFETKTDKKKFWKTRRRRQHIETHAHAFSSSKSTYIRHNSSSSSSSSETNKFRILTNGKSTGICSASGDPKKKKNVQTAARQ